MLCAKCGQELPYGAAACPACGEGAATVQQPPPQPMYYQPIADQPQATAAGKNSFVANGLGPIILGVFFLSALLAGAYLFLRFPGSPIFTNIIKQFFVVGMISISAAASTQLKGPDLSVGHMMSVASVFIATSDLAGSLFSGIILAMLVCGIFGLINGAIISFLRVPSVIVTLITSVLLRACAFAMTGGQVISGNFSQMLLSIDISAFGGCVLLLLSIGLAFLSLLLCSKLPFSARNNGKDNALTHMFGYGLTALIAVLAGLALTSRIHAAIPMVSSGYEMHILFVCAAILSSKWLSGKSLVALSYALIVAMILALTTTVLPIWGSNAFLQQSVLAIMALVFVVIAGITNKEGFTRSLLQR